MVNYSGEIDVLGGTEQKQCIFYAPSGAGRFNVNYLTGGANPVVVRGIDGSPEPTSQNPGTNVTYEVSNPERGVVVNYTGQMSLQWVWVP